MNQTQTSEVFPTLVNTSPTSKKDQINRILDLNETSNQTKQEVVYILNGITPDNSSTGNMTKDQYFELTKVKVRSRKRHDSTDSEGSSYSKATMGELMKPLYGQKEIIYVDLKTDDSLQKLALTFNCTVAELKLANKIYTDQDLFALRTIKIPVVKDGALHTEYLKKQSSVINSSNNAQTFIADNVESKYKFRVQSEELINPDLSYMTDSSDNDDVLFDMPNSTNEQSSLLRSERNVRLGQPINEHGANFNDFIADMDAKIEVEIAKVEARKETLDDAVNSLTTKIIFPASRKEPPEKYGSIMSMTWKQCLCAVCFVAILLPILGYLMYYYKKKKH